MKYTPILLAIFIAACDPRASIDSLPESKAIANKFFNEFKADNYNEILKLYDEAFWSSIPKNLWIRALPNINDELGPLLSCKLSTWNQRTQASTEVSGNFVVLQYACKHDKYDSTITFTTVKPLSGGETKIVGQNFSSIGLLVE